VSNVPPANAANPRSLGQAGGRLTVTTFKPKTIVEKPEKETAAAGANHDDDDDDSDSQDTPPPPDSPPPPDPPELDMSTSVSRESIALPPPLEPSDGAVARAAYALSTAAPSEAGSIPPPPNALLRPVSTQSTTSYRASLPLPPPDDRLSIASSVSSPPPPPPEDLPPDFPPPEFNPDHLRFGSPQVAPSPAAGSMSPVAAVRTVAAVTRSDSLPLPPPETDPAKRLPSLPSTYSLCSQRSPCHLHSKCVPGCTLHSMCNTDGC